MNDPLGLIGAGGPRGITPQQGGAHSAGKADDNAPKFIDLLKENLEEVNRLQADASQAMEDLAAGRRGDLTAVIGATEKADLAFQMLLQVRNQVMDAYEELQQMRV